MKHLTNIGNQLLEAIAYGDALGLSFETYQRDEVLRTLGSTTLMLSGMSRNSDFSGEMEGVWSDDTQLSMAVTESLIRMYGFDLEDQAQTHIGYMDQTPVVERNGRIRPRGWGGSTANSIERLMQGYEPRESGEFEGAGNGVLMKLAPLVFWHYVKNTDPLLADRDVVELTRMTHNSDEAVVASLVHKDVLKSLLTSGGRKGTAQRWELAEFAAHRAEYYEEVYDPYRKAVSSHLTRLSSGGSLTPERLVNLAPNGGFYAPETLLLVYGSFILKPLFPESVQEVIKLGGDTDTTAAIMAAMSLFNAHEITLPADAEMLHERDRLRKLSKQFTKIALEEMNDSAAE